MSVPASTSGLSGPADSRLGHTRAGRRLAYRPRAFRMPRSAASGRPDDGPRSYAGSPTAPSRMASADLAAASVASGSGGRLRPSAAAPIRASGSSNEWPNLAATAPSTFAAPAMTSGPMPSPGRRRMEAFTGGILYRRFGARGSGFGARGSASESAIGAIVD